MLDRLMHCCTALASNLMIYFFCSTNIFDDERKQFSRVKKNCQGPT